MWGMFVTWDIYSDRHEALDIVIYLYWSEIEQSGLNVVVILNVPSWLCGFLCYRGYKPARAQQAPLWEGLWRQGCSREEEGLTWIGMYERGNDFFNSQCQDLAYKLYVCDDQWWWAIIIWMNGVFIRLQEKGDHCGVHWWRLSIILVNKGEMVVQNCL